MKWLSRSVPVLTLWLALSPAARPQTPPVRILEIMAGANGDSTIQFIVIETSRTDRHLWGPQAGEEHSRTELAFFDRADRETGVFRFAVDPPPAGSGKLLVATEAFARLSGAPVPDIVAPPLLEANAGRVCFRNNALNTASAPVGECVTYGDPPLPITDTYSLRRSNGESALSDDPRPTNGAGETFRFAQASLVAQGALLFGKETFGGNGRTCATCHVETDAFGLLPENVAERFRSLEDGAWDPLFIAETASSGFDFNLNTLEIDGPVRTPIPCTGELRGDLRDASDGRAHVVARLGPTTYLVYGGLAPRLSGLVTDGACTAMVREVVPGDLDALEDPARMREAGRALILENIDGFGSPPVFRRSPHLLNLAYTAPYGMSGEFEDLRSFSEGAVLQHFPRSLSRSTDGDRPDLRLPTRRELEALEAFMLDQEFPPGDDPDKFDLSRFATTSLQRRGRDEFVTFGCEACHGGPVLAETTIPVLGKEAGTNAAFDTGIRDDSLPCEPASAEIGRCGSREFSTPQLFNLPRLGPFFHAGTAFTIADAVDFYRSSDFAVSPPNLEFIATGVGVVGTDAIVAFLEGLVVRSYALGNGPIRLDPASPSSVTIRNMGPTPLDFSDPACRLTGPDAAAFTIVGCPLRTPLAPEETRQIDVAVAPDSAGGDGPKTAILEVWPEGDAPSGVELVIVEGN